MQEKVCTKEYLRNIKYSRYSTGKAFYVYLNKNPDFCLKKIKWMDADVKFGDFYALKG